MSDTKPNPGHGYIVRELLGRGRWKEVYRVVARGEWHDRALARFIEKPVSADALLAELKVLLIDKLLAHPILENVAKLYGAFKGEDGEIYLVEELLYRPLDALSPMMLVDRFLRIAHDLCNGLAFLHGLGLVHRDLKLDNCGIDYAGSAKIFDLGSVTSEGGKVQGTTLSRAPELFASNAQCTKQSDVWAMGAVLFALRSGGDYPFVSSGEVKTRPREGEERAKFDQEISRRVHEPDAESKLRTRVEEWFPNGSKKLLVQMLAFAPAERPSAKECAAQWQTLLRPWVEAPRLPEAGDLAATADDIAAYLSAVVQRSAGMSSLQWERVSSAIDEIEKNKENLDGLRLSKLRELREEVNRLRESVV